MRAATYHRLPADAQEFGEDDAAVWELLARRDWERSVIYSDSTSADVFRRGLERLRADAKLSRFEVVVVHHLELLHRAPRELGELRGELAALGVEIVSVIEAAAPAAVKRKGRPPREFSVRRARELRAARKSIRAIARELGVGVATVHRALEATNTAQADDGRVTQDHGHAPDLEITTAIH